MIEIDNVSYSYSNTDKASLTNLNLKILDGEAVAFIGKSGCGKTTITRIINGLAYNFYEGKINGSIKINGESLINKKLYEIGRNVGSIFQNPKSQFFAEDVEDEIAFGPENYGMQRELIDCLVKSSLKSINAFNLRGKSLFNLSSGEKQKIAIASINALNPNIYVFDEPSANLDMESIESLKDLMLTLKSKGKTLVVSEHRIYYLRDIIDKYYYIQNGKIISCFSKNDLIKKDESYLKKLGIRSINLEAIEPQFKEEKGKNNLTIENLSFSYSSKILFDDLNYTFSSKNIYGIIGKNGVGKSTFSKVLCGLIKECNGKVYFNERLLKRRNRKRLIYYLSNNTDSNLFEVSLDEEIRLNNKNVDCEKLLSEYNMGNMINCHPLALSGGQKQRVTIAAAEVLDREVFIFDEPTSGLDADSMFIVSERMKKLKEEEKIVIIISHDYEFLMATCSKILKLESNCITSLDPMVDKERILRTMQGEDDKEDYENVEEYIS